MRAPGGRRTGSWLGRPHDLLAMIPMMAGWALMASAVADPTAAGSHGDRVPPSVAIGLGGRYRAGSWTSVRVGTTPGQTVHVWAEDPDGMFVRSPRAAEDATETTRASVRVGRPTGRLRIERAMPGEPSPDGGSSAGRWIDVALPEPIPSSHEVFVVVGDLPAARQAVRLLGGGEGPPASVVPLPEGESGADGGRLSASDFDLADVIIACGRAVPEFAPEVLAGIDAWVREGGRLLFCCGRSAERVAGSGGVAAGWIPGQVERLVKLRRLSALEAFARFGGLVSRPGAMELQVPRLAVGRELGGSVDFFEGSAPTDLPLVVRFAHGLGVVTWIGFDLDEEPLRSWAGTAPLLLRALGGRRPEADGAGPASGDQGVGDLAAQLRTALERSGGPSATGLAPISFEVIAGLGLLYVLCLYPLDWWLVSRGRPAVAWLTLPALVAGWSALAFGLAAFRRPSAPVVRFAEVVDVDATVVRGHSWAVVWSPDNAEFSVGLPTPADQADTRVSWFADSGTGFGGIDARTPHPSLAADDYRYARSLADLEGVPVAAASDRLFEAEWHRALNEIPIRSTLVRDAQNVLRGGIAHQLPFTLEQCRLAHGGWVYDVGRLPPGTTFDLASGRGPRSLAGALTRRAAVRERETPARWDPAETDLTRILEVAGFHAAAGGSAYTGLRPGRLGRLDLSPLLSVDRAVLFGIPLDPSPEWTSGWAFRPSAGPEPDVGSTAVARLVRIVIPLPAAGGEP
jgi:hypothetical protein